MAMTKRSRHTARRSSNVKLPATPVRRVVHFALVSLDGSLSPTVSPDPNPKVNPTLSPKVNPTLSPKVNPSTAKPRTTTTTRHRANTPAARAAQARRDLTTAIQLQLEAVVPVEYLEMDEEEGKGLDPRARVMRAATAVIRDLSVDRTGRDGVEERNGFGSDCRRDDGVDQDRLLELGGIKTCEEQTQTGRCDACKGTGRSGDSVGIPSASFPYFPETPTDIGSLINFRHYASGVVRMAQAMEQLGHRKRVEVSVDAKIHVVNKLLREVIHDLEELS